MRKFFTLVLSICVLPSFGQEAMRVVRCDAVSNLASIQNIYVDDENQKWVGNEEGLTKVLDLSLGEKVEIPAGQQSVIEIPGGNVNLNISLQDIEKAIGVKLEGENKITCAQYHQRRKELWVGTSESGAFRLKVEPQIKLVSSVTTKNSKLKSDQINTIYVDPFGRIWIGTNDGVLVGKDNKWDLKERYFNFTRVRLDSSNQVWLLADDLLGYMNRKQVWTPVDIPEAALDGPLVDFTFDTEGYLWVATEVIARIDLNTEDYDIFGPAEYYTSQYATELESDLDGSIWVATEDKGLYLIEPASAMTVNCLVDKPLDCANQGNTAALSVRVSGGFPPYNYDWEGGLSGENPKNLGKGSYIVTVTDSRGNQKIAKAEITDPNVLAEATMLTKASGLNQEDGEAKVEVTQGLAPFTYLWDNGEKTETAIGLGEGTHTVTVTDDNGCSTTAEVEMQRIIGALAAQVEQSSSIRCAGNAEASIEVNAEGGKEPFSYAWSNGSTAKRLENLTAGEYSVTITDVLNNQTVATYLVEEPGPLKASIDIISPASTDRSDGQAYVIEEGGTGPFEYLWTNGSKTDTVLNLAPGTHEVTLIDANGCETKASTVIDENILALDANFEITQPIKCFGQSEASFVVNVRGGKGPFRYQWNKTTLKGNQIENMRAGEYIVTVTDISGQSVVKNVNIPEPGEIKVETDVIKAASVGENDAKVELVVEGGTAPFQFQWENGRTGAAQDNLGTGRYNVMVTDANGCQTTHTFTVDENILELTTEIEIIDEVLCGGKPGGAVKAIVKGGKGPFVFKWNTGSTEDNINDLTAGAYYVAVEDAVGNKSSARIALDAPPALVVKVDKTLPANTDQEDGQATVLAEGGVGPYQFSWDNGENTDRATKLAPGTRIVSVTDQNGCVTEKEVTIKEDVKTLTASLKVIKPITCNGDTDASLQVELQGGKGPFDYVWNVPGVEGESPVDLKPGNYSVDITDATGQTSRASIEIENPDTLTLEIINAFSSVPGSSPDGYAFGEVEGGVKDYTFLWSNGETEQAAARLSVGRHMLTVTDANGCKEVDTIYIKERLIPGLSLSKIEIGKRISLDQISFQADSTNLLPDYYPILDELYDFMISNPNVNIEIGGHTNNLPPDDYCDRLSRGRAQAAADYLIKTKGLPIWRVFYKGYGKRDPIASNDTAEGRAQNQRIELKVISIRNSGG